MNVEQIRLVQSSFEQVRPIPDKVAEIFYVRLFEVASDTRNLFTGDMKILGAMLMGTLELAVRNLDRLETILPAMRTPGQVYMGYGVRVEHFAIVSDAFLGMLEQAFGSSFTPELKEAWAAAYMTLAGVMQEVALPVQSVNDQNQINISEGE